MIFTSRNKVQRAAKVAVAEWLMCKVLSLEVPGLNSG